VGNQAPAAGVKGAVLDSGATNHVSRSFQCFSDLVPLNPHLKLNLASERNTMVATHSGNLKVSAGNGEWAIPAALYSPQMTGTILSLGQLIDLGFSPSFSPNKDIILRSPICTIAAKYNTPDRTWYISSIYPTTQYTPVYNPPVTSFNPLQQLESYFPNPSQQVLDSYYWHCRLGHVSDDVVKSFLKAFVPKFDIKSWSPFFCKSCKIAKSERRRHSLPETIPRDHPLDLFVTDVLGPLEPDPFGNQYLLTARNHASTYSFVYPMKNQGEVSDLIIQLIKRLVTQFGKPPKFIQSNNAKEYTSHKLLEFSKPVGIQLIFSSPYTPKQNGEAERLNRTLGGMARTMLLHSKMPQNMWPYAYRCACWISNRLPNSRTKSFTPLKLWLGRDPIPQQLHPFGSKAAIHIPKEIRKKLDDRAWIGFLVGYQEDGRGWIFWNPTNNQYQASECATFLDFNGRPLLNHNSAPHIRKTYHLGQVPTDEICDAQDSLIEEIGFSPDIDIPSNLRQALKSPHSNKWRQACITEWNQLEEIGTWEVQDKTDQHAIGTRIVFDLKQDSNGKIEKFKARFVARGFKQRLGVDVKSTFAPTASLSTLRLLLSMSVKFNWSINAFDVTGAFVHSPIDKTIYVEPPKDLFPHLSGKTLLLKKALYGTRQARRCWLKHFKSLVQQWDFTCDEVEECVYKLQKGTIIVIIWIHVNDGIVFSNSPEHLTILRENLENSLHLKWFDAPDKIVGLKLERSPNQISLSQHLLINQLLLKHNREFAH
jgi:hypothetical protein